MATGNDTGAERYLRERLRDPEYRGEYDRARRRIDMVDRFIRAVDARREGLGLTKADLARRAGMKPEAVRRLLSAEHPNPTLNTLVALADVLGFELALTPDDPRRVPDGPSPQHGPVLPETVCVTLDASVVPGVGGSSVRIR